MKKLIGAIAIFGLSLCTTEKAEAQFGGTALKSSGGYTKDTVTSTTTKYLVYSNGTDGKITGRPDVIVVATGLEINGTTSGNIRIEASMDSVTWYPYYTGTGMIDSANGSLRLQLADQAGAQNIRWVLPKFSDQYLRVAGVGNTTTNWSLAAKAYGRKP